MRHPPDQRIESTLSDIALELFYQEVLLLSDDDIADLKARFSPKAPPSPKDLAIVSGLNSNWIRDRWREFVLNSSDLEIQLENVPSDGVCLDVRIHPTDRLGLSRTLLKVDEVTPKRVLQMCRDAPCVVCVADSERRSASAALFLRSRGIRAFYART